MIFLHTVIKLRYQRAKEIVLVPAFKFITEVGE